MEERRTARRYKLALEIKLQPELNQFQPISGFTRDISSRGFSFGTSEMLCVGMMMWFSIMLPPFEAVNTFINGRARVVRVEDVSGIEQGIGAVIEGFSFDQSNLLKTA